MIIYFDLGIGGVQRKIVDIVNACADQDPRHPVIVLLEGNRENILASGIHHPNARIYKKPHPRLPFWLFIAAHIILHNPAALLSFLALPSIYAERAIRLTRSRARFIIGQDVVTSDAYMRGDFSGEMNGRIRDAFQRADAILVPNSVIARDLSRAYGVSQERIRVTPNWARTHKGPTKKTVDCLYVGRFDKEKRIDRMIDIVRLAQKHKPDITFRAVGDGAEREDLMRRVARHNLARHVRLLPPEPLPRRHFVSAKVALCTSDSEGTPMFLLEAMASGLPVVTTGYPGAASLIKHGRSGFVCNNTAQFVSALDTLLSDDALRKRMGTEARRVATTHYSLRNIARYTALLLPAYE